MNRKTVLLFCLALTFFNFSAEAQNNGKVTKVVIDAGHGGNDPGCLGKISKEKDVNLKVALKLGKLITENYDDVQVIYTRRSDISVPLYKRAEVANNNHADLFISIHCNASENKNARGVETFVMGLSKSEANQAVARKENAAILKEKNYENNYEGFDPNSPEAGIVFSLQTSIYLKNSTSLASKVQKNLVTSTKLIDRTVQQAEFWVLYKVAMPSILVELGFLTHPQEEEFLLSSENQDMMAISIFNAFVDYKNQLEGTNKPFLSFSSEKNKGIQSDKPSSTDSKTTQDKTVGVRFRVQFMTTPENLSLNRKEFSSLVKVKKYQENKTWKYTSGDELTYEEAQVILKQVKKNYPDAFIIAFQDEIKIPVSEARKLTKK